jgi:hypothetical protein
MKKIISLPAIFSFCCFAVLLNRADAQSLAKNSVVVEPKSLSAAMKLTEDPQNEVADITYVNEVNQKATRDFKKTFKDVNNEKWYSIKDGFLAEFSLNATKTRVLYNKKGNWTFTISYYDEKNLPADVRAIVKPVYYDYTISRVEEVHAADKTFYFVHVQNESSLKTLRICEGEMDLISDFQKSN